MANWHREWLKDNGFVPVGTWSSPVTEKFRRSPALEAAVGIYAFVVEGTIFYIGKSEQVDERIPAYDRRLIPATPSKPHRAVHVGISDTLSAGKTVEAWAVKFDERRFGQSLGQLELDWIRKFSPIWNLSGPRPFFLPFEILERVDDWVAARPEPRPSRSQAIRRLLAEALSGRSESSSVSDISAGSVVLTDGELAVLEVAVNAGEYETTSQIVGEAIRDWQVKRDLQHGNVERLRQLWDEGKASGAPKPFDIEHTLAAAKARLAEASSE